jgi:tetratricopeptide (TPR) repeat protein
MKTKVVLTLCVVFVVGVASANAQTTLIAGSPQDKAYTAAMAATDLDKKIVLLLDFEKQFPDSKALPDIYIALMDAYRQKSETDKANDVGERTIKIDPENFSALLTVSRNYAIAKKKLDVAVPYAQKAVDILEKRKTESRYSEDAAWKAYIDQTLASAKANLNFVRSVKPS